MPKVLTTAEFLAQAGQPVPTANDMPELAASLVSTRQQQAVHIEYTVDTPVSTNSMLAVAHRMLADNYDLQRVVLRRLGNNLQLTIEITLDKQPDRSISEVFTCIQPSKLKKVRTKGLTLH